MSFSGGWWGGTKSFSHQTQLFVIRFACAEIVLGFDNKFSYPFYIYLQYLAGNHLAHSHHMLLNYLNLTKLFEVSCVMLCVYYEVSLMTVSGSE